MGYPLYLVMSERDDSALVLDCLNGNNRAFEELIRRYEGAIHNLALRMTRDPDDAMDVCQTVFAKAYQKLSSFQRDRQFFSWIYRIAVNESINWTKKRKFHDEYESGAVALDAPSPEQSFSKDEVADEVEDAIGMLKTDYKMVIVLKHFHDFSYSEMSDVLGIPEKTVKSRLFSARQQLKHILERKGITR